MKLPLNRGTTVLIPSMDRISFNFYNWQMHNEAASQPRNYGINAQHGPNIV